MKKTTRLKQLIRGPILSFAMEAHNALSAKIAEEAGFPAVWGSGLAIAAAMGVRDRNEASWTDVLQVVEFMSDATTVPILLDGDTGHGNFNNVRRLVRKLEQRQVAGVCIEDKLFPKTNSLIGGAAQPLADVGEFCGRIKAGKDAQTCGDFTIVARVEAFIAGRGLAEALRRAEAYRRAGADAIFIHSALANASEVLAFMREWGDRSPVVIAPTRYASTPTDVFRSAGFSLCIWGNHLLRAAIKAMQHAAGALFAAESAASIEDELVPLAEVFRIQDEPEVAAAERRYLPVHRSARPVAFAVRRRRRRAELVDAERSARRPVGRALLGQ